MIQCPRCHQSLPDWAQKCQFCQADTSAVAKVAMAASGDYQASQRSVFESPKWVWPAYYVMAVLFILQGILPLVMGVVMLQNPKLGEVSAFTYIPIIIGLIFIVVGIGLIAKVEAVRGITNIFCWVAIAVGVLSSFGDLLWALAGHGDGVIHLISDIVQIGSAGFMIYLLGVTDEFGY